MWSGVLHTQNTFQPLTSFQVEAIEPLAPFNGNPLQTTCKKNWVIIQPLDNSK